nr:hypothetical protein CFP56_09723 [Quercus suber]
MTAQVVLESTAMTNASPHRFRIQAQDKKLQCRSVEASAASDPPLGLLSNFAGTFIGTGFNSIFRPNSGPPTTTTFPNAVSFPANGPGNDNVLELNLTTEKLTFGVPGAPTLGSVPNRGEKPQEDIFLNGVPYLQQIDDVSNPTTGKADGNPSGIHFETGLWMHVPATTTDPVLGESLVRMGSIPHGTTINAQCLAPTTSFNGPPKFPVVDMTPFPIGNSASLIRFPSQTASDNRTPRLPQDLSKFIAAGTITQAVLDNPNMVLQDANQGKNIKRTTVFTVSTSSTAPELGGGTANIAFLQGAATGQTQGPNALAVQMSATFWVNEVVHKITVPSLHPSDEPIDIAAPVPHSGAPVTTFTVLPPKRGMATKTINVTSTEIQYSQTVFLNFAGLTWPHVSVATLIPANPVIVPSAKLD